MEAPVVRKEKQMNTQNEVDPKAGRDTVPPHPEEDLKSERVQDALTAGPAGESWSGEIFAPPLDPGSLQARLKSERVQEELKSMPGWRLTPGGKAINRAKAFPTPEVARLFNSYVTGYAGAVGLPVMTSIAAGQVLITLHAPRSRGRAGLLTEAVLELGRRLG
jgi:pterin-4a-carbinolamine dehydratase